MVHKEIKLALLLFFVILGEFSPGPPNISPKNVHNFKPAIIWQLDRCMDANGADGILVWYTGHLRP